MNSFDRLFVVCFLRVDSLVDNPTWGEQQFRFRAALSFDNLFDLLNCLLFGRFQREGMLRRDPRLVFADIFCAGFFDCRHADVECMLIESSSDFIDNKRSRQRTRGQPPLFAEVLPE